MNAYNGLVAPSIDQYFPSHRANEQVAYGATLTKYLMFPTGYMTGVIAGKRTRISVEYVSASEETDSIELY